MMLSTAQMGAACRNLKPIASALQLKLILESKIGSSRVVLDPRAEIVKNSSGLDVKLDTKIVASGITKKDVWVLVRVQGNLLVLIAHVPADKQLYLVAFDAARDILAKEGPRDYAVYNGWSFVDITQGSLGQGAVGFYRRGVKEKKWEKVNGVSGLVGRPGVRAQEDGRKVNRR